MFTGNLTSANRLCSKMLTRYQDRYEGSSPQQCPAYKARDRLNEVVRMAQDQQTRISTKIQPYRQPSPHNRSDSGPLHPDHRRLQPRNGSALIDEIDLNYVSGLPAEQRSAGNDSRGRAPSRGASPGRTPQQKPVGLEGTNRQVIRPDSRPASPGPRNLQAGGAPPPARQHPPRACWSCGATTHIKAGCNASVAQKKIYRQAKLTQTDLLEAG